MKTLKPLALVLFLFIFAVDALPQGTRRRGPRRPVAGPAAPAPAAEPQAGPATTPITPLATGPISLATLNGQTITSADIDQNVRPELEALELRIGEARRQVLELQINTILLESEAARRRISPQQLYELEIAKKIADPTAAEVDTFIDTNRDKITETDPAAVRQSVIAYLRGDREARLTDDFLKRLRVAFPVVNNSTGTPSLPPASVIATVGARQITAGMIEERLKPIIYKLRFNFFQLAKQAVELTINDLLLLAESNRRNVPPEEIMRKEVSDKIHTPTEAEVAKFYADNKSKMTSPLTDISAQISSFLIEQDRQRLQQEMSTRLRAGANIRWLITEPALPVQTISADDDPVRGDANAAVTIVEFTDFQCPSCAAMQPILDEVQKIYGNKVKLVVRDFPLAMHPNARKAAEAANAAAAQGKFFEYAALLFKRQNALDVPSLKNYASELGLDRARFDAALDGGKYATEVKHDMDDGEIYGVDSTPAIFVNGLALTEMSLEALRALVDRGLGVAAKAPSSSK
jgi:predicted DsbA family dithiol-disulfide isomerase